MDTIREPRRKPPAYRVETIPRLHSVVVFDEEHPVNYISSCQIFTYGDVGLMFTINGKRFYDAMTGPGVLATLLKGLGIKSLEGYVVPSHARLMRFALRRVATVEDMHIGECAGHDMVWVRVRCSD